MADLNLTIAGKGPRGETVDPRGQPIRVPYTAPDPRFAAPYLAYSDLGRDFNGKPLVTERHAWLDREGITDDGVREYYLAMWRALDAERDLVSEERDEEREAQQQQSRK